LVAELPDSNFIAPSAGTPTCHPDACRATGAPGYLTLFFNAIRATEALTSTVYHHPATLRPNCDVDEADVRNLDYKCRHWKP
jgi:hypothetical protein